MIGLGRRRSARVVRRRPPVGIGSHTARSSLQISAGLLSGKAVRTRPHGGQGRSVTEVQQTTLAAGGGSGWCSAVTICLVALLVVLLNVVNTPAIPDCTVLASHASALAAAQSGLQQAGRTIGACNGRLSVLGESRRVPESRPGDSPSFKSTPGAGSAHGVCVDRPGRYTSSLAGVGFAVVRWVTTAEKRHRLLIIIRRGNSSGCRIPRREVTAKQATTRSFV